MFASVVATSEDRRAAPGVQLRLRLAPVRRKWLAETAGGLIDLVTIAGLAAGLKERIPAARAPL